jgi:translation initiation factor IF-2
VRSEKRASAAKTKPAKAKAAPAKPKAKPKPKPAAAKPKAEPKAAPAPPPSPPPQQPSDPIGIALKAGETVALTGLKVAGKVASGVLRRLPRP